MTSFNSEKSRASAWFRQMRDDIVMTFEGLEDSHDTGPMSDRTAGRFEVSNTKRDSGDGSEAG
jgi:coproporphyrinogen III oxidase